MNRGGLVFSACAVAALAWLGDLLAFLLGFVVLAIALWALVSGTTGAAYSILRRIDTPRAAQVATFLFAALILSLGVWAIVDRITQVEQLVRGEIEKMKVTRPERLAWEIGGPAGLRSLYYGLILMGVAILWGDFRKLAAFRGAAWLTPKFPRPGELLYMQQAGVETGPFDINDLRQLWVSGVFNAGAMWRRERESQWHSATYLIREFRRPGG